MDFGVSTTPNGPTTDIFGFCVDIFHEITLGSLGYAYNSTFGDTTNPLTHNFDPAQTSLTGDQITKITDLVDTGYLLHQADPTGSALQTAAIQAAIWQIENPTVDITLVDTGNGDFSQYETAYGAYLDGKYTDLATADDRIYLISDEGDPAHQTFAIGWPNAVPEPTTWALMLTGFFGVGGMLRRRQAAAATA